jgi:hypothetical protein
MSAKKSFSAHLIHELLRRFAAPAIIVQIMPHKIKAMLKIMQIYCTIKDTVQSVFL